jgi:chorismate mutase
MHPGCLKESLPEAHNEDGMTLEELRSQIDVLDRQLVELLSERARAALMIGHLKVQTSLPVYEPAREKIIYANVRAANKGPLPDIELTHIYERIIDVMRALQRNELASERDALRGHGTGAATPPQQGPVAGDPGYAPETGNEK